MKDLSKQIHLTMPNPLLYCTVPLNPLSTRPLELKKLFERPVFHLREICLCCSHHTCFVLKALLHTPNLWEFIGKYSLYRFRLWDIISSCYLSIGVPNEWLLLTLANSVPCSAKKPPCSRSRHCCSIDAPLTFSLDPLGRNNCWLNHQSSHPLY